MGEKTMKKYVNGQYIEMTAEEIAELERLTQEMQPPEPTMDERMAELEEALELLLSGVTE